MLAVNIGVHLAGNEAVRAIIGVVAIGVGAALIAYDMTMNRGHRLKVGCFTAEPAN